jgi:hypothetical protein
MAIAVRKMSANDPKRTSSDIQLDFLLTAPSRTRGITFIGRNLRFGAEIFNRGSQIPFQRNFLVKEERLPYSRD